MLRTPVLLLAALLAAGCGDAPPPAPAVKTPVARPTPAPLPPPVIEPPAPGADDPRCTAAAVYLNALRSAAGQPTPQLAAIRGAYQNTALQQLVQASDLATGRKDDPAIVALLASSDTHASTSAEYAIHGALAQWMRHNLKVAAEDKDRSKRGEAWAAARCVWAQDLRHLGLAVQKRNTSPFDDASIVDQIDAAFTAGATAVTADPVDERALLPARQTVEKTWYRVVHRELALALRQAHDDKDLAAVRRASGLFDMLRDRLADKNSPGVAIIDAALAGDPAAIDPAAVLREVDVALAKRARKYCSEAVDPKLHNTAAGLASVTEGAVYTRLLLPDMQARLGPKFDAEAHRSGWQTYLELVESGEDPAELKTQSDDLVRVNCAYQQALGIRECTATADEVASKPAKKK